MEGDGEQAGGKRPNHWQASSNGGDLPGARLGDGPKWNVQGAEGRSVVNHVQEGGVRVQMLSEALSCGSATEHRAFQRRTGNPCLSVR